MICSLFSGYGGLDIAAQEVFSLPLAFVSDIEPGPCRIPHGVTWPCRECGDTTPGVQCPDDIRELLAGITTARRNQP